MTASDSTRYSLAEAIERLASMPAFLEAAIEAADADAVSQRPGPGEYSLTEHACHLRDLEREGFLVSVRRMLAETAPVLEPFDGEAAARGRDYPSQDARQAAREFTAARGETPGLLTPLAPAQLAREASFCGRRVTFAQVLAMMVEHDAAHREQIERLIEQLED